MEQKASPLCTCCTASNFLQSVKLQHSNHLCEQQCIEGLSFTISCCDRCTVAWPHMRSICHCRQQHSQHCCAVHDRFLSILVQVWLHDICRSQPFAADMSIGLPGGGIVSYSHQDVAPCPGTIQCCHCNFVPRCKPRFAGHVLDL